MTDWTEGWPYREWAERVRSELIPMIDQSAITMSLVPSDGTFGDIKFAVELGVSIMLDKPIIAMVRPGTPIPSKLVKVCDRIVEIDFDDDPEKTSKAVFAAVQAVARRKGINLDKED